MTQRQKKTVPERANSHAKTASSSILNVPPKGATGVLVLADGTCFWGYGAGAPTSADKGASGEICFNTSMTGYQEILTDPSYCGQIICFTFPHIGNVGANIEDIETMTPVARGLVLRAPITDPANFRSTSHLSDWLASHNLTAVTGIDTRRLTRRLREQGAINGVVAYDPQGNFDVEALTRQAASCPHMEGQDLAADVTCTQAYEWDETAWHLGEGYGRLEKEKFNVVAVDFGAKRNILRCLADLGCKVTVVPAKTSAKDILGRNPDGVFLSNGPGDPAATGDYAAPMIKKVVESGTPVFGICLGHQMLALALGASTKKMHHGHRGANHPVKDLETGKVEITSQNHGFVVDEASLPEGVVPTHISLFDKTLEGLRLEGKPVFSVQHHPEASPGPRDSHYLFARFVKMMEDNA